MCLLSSLDRSARRVLRRRLESSPSRARARRRRAPSGAVREGRTRLRHGRTACHCCFGCKFWRALPSTTGTSTNTRHKRRRVRSVTGREWRHGRPTAIVPTPWKNPLGEFSAPQATADTQRLISDALPYRPIASILQRTLQAARAYRFRHLSRFAEKTRVKRAPFLRDRPQKKALASQ